jgi:hypothetical protein
MRWGGENTYEQWGFGIAFSTTQVRAAAVLSVQMRAIPSASASLLRVQDGSNGININLSGTGGTEISTKILALNLTGASGLTAFRPYFCDFQGSTSGYLFASAEL